MRRIRFISLITAIVMMLFCLSSICSVFAEENSNDNAIIYDRIYSGLISGYNNYHDFNSSWLNMIDEYGKFSDLSYTYSSSDSSSTKSAVRADRYTHVYRLKGMAAEYSVSGRTLYKDETLLDKLILATDFYVFQMFDQVGNTGDWSNALECPRILADVFIMLRESGHTLDEIWLMASKDYYFDLHTRYDPANNITAYQFAMATSNLPITCNLWRTLAVLYNDFTYVEKIYNSLAISLVDHVDDEGYGVMADDADKTMPSTVKGVTYFGDGYYPDGTYYSHGAMQYTYGYGLTFLRGDAGYVKLAAGTSWQFSQEELSVLVDLLLDNFRWLTRGDNGEFNTYGRNISVLDSSGRKTNTARVNILDALDNLLEEPNIPRRDELLKFKVDLEEDATINKNGNTATNYVTGNKHFWQSDMMAHQRDKYSAILKMSSTRTLKSERVSKEGTNNYYMATGTLPIMITGHEYEKAIAVWDWDRLPGITAINKDEDVPEQTELSHIVNRHFGSHSFVGGASDGSYGVAAMDYLDNLKTKTTDEYQNPSPPVVQAKKAWFFFDDEVVALGTDISSTDTENNLLTNLNQCILDGSVTYKDASGQNVLASETLLNSESLNWVHHGKVGYVFPEFVKAAISNKSQTGNARREGDTTYPDYTRNIFSMYVDHGKGTEDDTYSYIIVPNKTVDEVSAYYDNIPLQILQNDKNIQAVYHDDLQLVQAVFRTEGSLTINNYTITVDKPCIVMVKFSLHDINVYVQNPENTQIDINVELKYKDQQLENMTFTTRNGLFAGETVSMSTENIYKEKNYLMYEFNDPSYQGEDYFDLDAGGGTSWPYPVIETFDGEGVATFDSNKGARVGFRISQTNEGYQAVKNLVDSGKELIIETKVYYNEYKKHELCILGDLFYNIEDELYIKGGTKIGDIKTGWNIISIVVFLGDDGYLYYKDLIVNGKKDDSAIKFSSALDTSDEFFLTRSNATLTYLYKHPSATQQEKTYMDYLRFYTTSVVIDNINDINFLKSESEKAETISDVTLISLKNDVIKDGAVVYAAFYNNHNLLIGTNKFDINSINSEEEVTKKTLQKPDNYADIKVFVFNNSDSIKPLTSLVLFSDTIN